MANLSSPVFRRSSMAISSNHLTRLSYMQAAASYSSSYNSRQSYSSDDEDDTEDLKVLILFPSLKEQCFVLDTL